MNNIANVTVNVKTNLTISDDTAYTILGLLEMYCRDKRKIITVSHSRLAGTDDPFEVSLDFEEDKEYDEFNKEVANESYNRE